MIILKCFILYMQFDSLFILLLYMFFFFFFQAEDGIRDLTVTGVQTCALPIYGLANDEAFAARGASIGFRPGNRAAAAVLPLGLVTGALLGAHLLQALWSAEAAIGGAELEEHAGRLRVNLFTFGLDHRWLVPVHTEPVQALLDRGLAVGLETSTVRVLDAQQELAVFLAGEQVIEERGACAAEMQRPCWARRIANTDSFVDPGHLTIVLSGKCRPLRHINDGQICPRLH